MPAIPESVRKAWDDRDGAAVLTTVDKDGVPNSIYASSVSMFGDDKIVVANNYFDKTMKNIESESSASILFITSEKKSYQLKGALEYYSEGEIFDDMKKWNPERHPGHGAAVVLVGSIYSGAEKIL